MPCWQLPAAALVPAVTVLPPPPMAALQAGRPDWPLWLGLLLATAAVAAIVRTVYRSLKAPGRQAPHSGPFLVFPVPPPGAAHEARPSFAPQPAAEPTSPVAPSARPPATPQPSQASPAEAGASVFEGHTIRFFVPTDGTLQLLPGRLEIVGGQDLGQEIRFVRAPEGPQEITFGRSDGPPHRHIQLRAATVSRAHARMVFAEEGWTIYNLSRTNPVVLNGSELDGSESGHPLSDGDRIEMGEVVFAFRER